MIQTILEAARYLACGLRLEAARRLACASRHDKKICVDRALRRFGDRQHGADVVGRRCDLHIRRSVLDGRRYPWHLGWLSFRTIDVVVAPLQ